MKVKLSILLFLFTVTINLNAQFKAAYEKISESAALEEVVNRLDPQPFIDRFNKANAIDPEKLLAEQQTQSVLRKATSYNVGDKKNWWSSNFVTNQFYQSPSTCRAVGTNCYVFVEDSMWTSGNVNQTIVDAVKNAFDNSTPANATKGIYQTCTESFGNPPNVDGDSKIIIFLLNIPDGYSGKPGEGYVAGYFYSVNQSISHPNSNKSEIFYLDCKPANLTTASGLNNGMSTTAHEFQHMIHYNYHPSGQETFFNEAMSLAAEVVCGYGLYGQSGAQGYANNTNRYLLNWNRTDGTDVLKDYSRSARFALYLYEQFGVNVLKNFVQSVRKGVDAFDNDVFPKLGTTRRFNDVLQDWFIANYVNDKSVNSKWGYSYTPLAKVAGANLTVTSSANVAEDGVYKAAAQYLTFSAGKNLTINFNRGTNNTVKVKVVKIGSGAPQVSDVTTNTNVNFSDFGSAYNTLTFIVYHNDMNVSSSGPFTYTYTYSGTAASGIKEIAYDTTEPTGYLQLTPGDSVAVQFDGILGAKLDSIKIALRGIVPIDGRVLEYTGLANKFGDKLLSNFTATSKLTAPPPVVNQGGEYPYETPYKNWVKVDLRNSNIDASKAFCVQLPIGAAYPAANRVLSTYYPSTSAYYSFSYKSNESPPRWLYYSVSGRDGFIFLFLIRAYISYGTSDISEPIEILPSAFTLDQNYPNPFNPSTVISYTLPKQSRVQIKIYDVIGNEVRSLIDEDKNAGKYNILWDSRNNTGSRVTSGVYFYKIFADGFTETKKMVLLK
ncbi:MAG: FG-GAP repeat protein [Ignavibacteria bacterium]|nr:MAG: FG-GAP repeat protein [Ignavibacteria bacterium]KAF0160095.1 MAG: FG-GAP repeat protein [Ignavibacteria bacterium]